MINLKQWVALALSLCLLMTGFALAEETALTDVVSAPVEAAPMEEELALQPYAPEEDVAVSAAEAGDDLPKAAGVRIDSENFPDADFRDYVSDAYDLDMDGYLSQDEIDAATSLSIGYLSSIKGIRFLKKLEYVDLYQLDLGDESINLSGFASLKTLDVYRCMYGSLNLKGCSKLEAASLYRYGAPSGSVNLSGCAALERLNIGLNGAMKVDISDCPRLIKAVKKGKKTDAVYGEEWEDYRPVTFQYKDYTLYCDVEAGVVINGVNVTRPTSIKLNKTGTVKLKMTDTLKLKATMKPATALSGLTWKSSNKKVATVTQSGRVRPKKPGTATITVKTANGKSAKVKVKVVAVKPTKVKITKGSKATIYVGGKLTLKAKLYPTGATSKLTWKSSDKKVATVSSKGVVKAKKKGTATITVKTANGKKAKIKITVKKRTWNTEYKKFILNQEYIEYLFGAPFGETAFALYDMDKNGVPELILYRNTGSCADNWNCAFTFKNGTVTYLGDVGFRDAHMYYYSNSAYPGLFCSDGNNGVINTLYYYLEKGELECESVLHEYPESETSLRLIEEVETNDEKLVKLVKTKTAKSLPEYSYDQICSMGWSTFVKKCPI